MPKRTNGTGSSKLVGDAAQTLPAAALQDLGSVLGQLNDVVTELNRLTQGNNFRYLSKRRRNELLMGLLEKGSSVEDACKGAFKVLKKVKRERAPEKLMDHYLANGATPNEKGQAGPITVS